MGNLCIVGSIHSEPNKNLVILQDVNRANPCEFPAGVSDSAVIANPCNNDEILIFGGYKSNDIYIYTKSTNTIKKNKVSIDTIRLITGVHVVLGNSKNTVIVLWNYPASYRVFDCDKMDFCGDTVQWSVDVSNGSCSKME